MGIGTARDGDRDGEGCDSQGWGQPGMRQPGMGTARDGDSQGWDSQGWDRGRGVEHSAVLWSRQVYW